MPRRARLRPCRPPPGNRFATSVADRRVVPAARSRRRASASSCRTASCAWIRPQARSPRVADVPETERTTGPPVAGEGRIPRNVWVASATSFLTDVSSEMLISVLPLFLVNVLGLRTSVIGLIEGVAGSVGSLVQVVSGWLSDRLGRRKWLTVAGYALSTAVKPGFAFATSWTGVAAIRWTERVGKGIRSAPRDALVADSTRAADRGFAFGLHRAADTGGAVIGLLLALFVVGVLWDGAGRIDRATFQALVWASMLPAVLAVAILAIGARDVPLSGPPRPRTLRVRGLGRRFAAFLAISALFDVGNFSDAFLIIRAQERGLAVTQILWLLVSFNVVYAVVSLPAGWLSDRLGRKQVLVAGWLLYAAIYLGFALVREEPAQVRWLFVAYGAYYGLTMGTAKALIADLVPEQQRAMAFGSYHAVLGLIDLPASLIAGLLWQGVGSWQGFGAAAPFYFGAATAALAALLLARFPTSPPGADATSLAGSGHRCNS
ncbi:MAG: MFS transporter [Myxococcales bacterium]|nr:MFS transporter [Myxococcales bacterium]